MINENMSAAQRAYERKRFPAKSAFVYGFGFIALEHGPDHIQKFLEFIQEFNEPVNDGHLNIVRYLNRIWTDGLRDGTYEPCENDPKMIRDIEMVLERWPDTFQLKGEFEYPGVVAQGLHSLNHALGERSGLTGDESVRFSTKSIP